MNTDNQLKLGLNKEQPLLPSSAKQQLSPAQQKFAIGLLAAGILGLILGINPLIYLIGFVAITTVGYLSLQALNIWLVASASSENALAELEFDVDALNRDALPTYAVLVPLFKETQVLEQLVNNLCELDYPPTKLRIFLLLEEDDKEMVKAVQALSLPDHFQVLIIPPSLPRTKPKALNVGLKHVESEFCVVFDAEDKPEPQQLLKAVAAFSAVGPEVICFQGVLAYHNPRQNLLTRFFAAEYSNWFNLYIPGMARNGWLFLLGGTSNHFRTQALREVGAWDPYNVTEDADLGIRIARAGYKVKAMASVTWEEANSRPISWIKQRSRWIKGYMQTYLAHMRNPFRLYAEMGFQKFLVFQLLMGVAPMCNLVNPIFWTLTLIYALTRWTLIEGLFPGPLLYLGAISMFFGNYVSVYNNLTGSVVQKEYGSVKWLLLSPIYWVMMSIAAWKAVHQLVFKPHYWEKTQHGVGAIAGVTTRPTQPGLANLTAHRPATNAAALAASVAQHTHDEKYESVFLGSSTD